MKIIFCTGVTSTAKEGHNSTVLYWHEKPEESTEEGPLSYVLKESPFTSVSTVNRGHPSLVSLVEPHRMYNFILRLKREISFKFLTRNVRT
jgi:hypothetical protein